MKKPTLKSFNLLFFIATSLIGAASLHALIFEATILEKQTVRIILLADRHNLGSFDPMMNQKLLQSINIMQMDNFFKNLEPLSDKGNNPIHIIAEGLFFNDIDLNKETEEAVAQKFYDYFKFLPTTKNKLLPKFNAKKTDLSKINPNANDITTWITWHLPTTFIKQKNSFNFYVTLTAMDPRRDIHFFGNILCQHLNNPSSKSLMPVSLGTMYDQIKNLQDDFYLQTKNFCNQNSTLNEEKALSFCKSKESHLKKLSEIFGNENMNNLFSGNIMKKVESQQSENDLLQFFCINKIENEKYQQNNSLMSEDTFLGKYLLELAFMNIILSKLNNTNNQNAHQIIIILAGQTHIKLLQNLLLSNFGFTEIWTFPDQEKKGKTTYNELVQIFDTLPKQNT